MYMYGDIFLGRSNWFLNNDLHPHFDIDTNIYSSIAILWAMICEISTVWCGNAFRIIYIFAIECKLYIMRFDITKYLIHVTNISVLQMKRIVFVMYCSRLLIKLPDIMNNISRSQGPCC